MKFLIGSGFVLGQMTCKEKFFVNHMITLKEVSCLNGYGSFWYLIFKLQNAILYTATCNII